MRSTKDNSVGAFKLLQRVFALAFTTTVFGTTLIGSQTAALADLRVCNKTEGNVTLAVGYPDDDSWVSEGWWTLEQNTCETLLPGDLVSRFYYFYAVQDDSVGEWGGKAFMCVRQKEFTIRGTEDCVARGYQRAGFFELDTGDQNSWTLQLTEPVQQGTGGR